jgi:sugar phosphate isomerase/epimerase
MPFGEHMDLACPDRGRRAKMIEEQKQALGYATDLGCKTATIHIGAFESAFLQTPNSDIRPFVVDSLEKLLPEAEKLGILLAIENSFERSNTPDEVLYYISQCDSPALGVCFDSGHANLMENFPGKEYSKYFGGVTIAWRDSMEYCNDALDKLLPHIVTCHLHDNNGYEDSHRMPFDGITDWDKLMKKLITAPRLQTMQTEVSMFRYGYSVKQLVNTFNKIIK